MSLGDKVSEELKQELIDIFNNNKEIFSDKPGLAKDYGCKLNLKPDVKLNRKSYPVTCDKISAVKDELKRMQLEGIIEVGESQYINLITIVQKPKGIRLCVDARELNRYIIRCHTEQEGIDQIVLKFQNCKYISSFDLTSGFHQILLGGERRQYVAFSLFGRVFRYVRLPFGLSISSSEFIRCLYQVLGDEVINFSIILWDDFSNMLANSSTTYLQIKNIV